MNTERDLIRTYIQKQLLYGAPLDDDQSPLFSNGAIDSLGVLQLIAYLEKTFHITIDTQSHELAEFDTVDLVVTLVDKLRPHA